MNKRTVILIAIVVILLLIVGGAIAADLGGKEHLGKKKEAEGVEVVNVGSIPAPYKDNTKEELTDETFKKLEENRAGTSQGYSVFEVHNIYNKPVPIYVDYWQVKGNVLNDQVYIELDHNCTEQSYKYKTIKPPCDPQPNGSNCEEKTVIDQTINTTVPCPIWNKTNWMPANYEGHAKLEATFDKKFKPQTIERSIEWVPFIKVKHGIFDLLGTKYTQEKWAWYNTSWLKKKCYNVTAALSFYQVTPVGVFIYNDTQINSSAGYPEAIRLADANGIEIAREFHNFSTPASGELMIRSLLNSTSAGTSYCIYYDFAGAPAADYSDCSTWDPCWEAGTERIFNYSDDGDTEASSTTLWAHNDGNITYDIPLNTSHIYQNSIFNATEDPTVNYSRHFTNGTIISGFTSGVNKTVCGAFYDDNFTGGSIPLQDCVWSGGLGVQGIEVSNNMTTIWGLRWNCGSVGYYDEKGNQYGTRYWPAWHTFCINNTNGNTELLLDGVSVNNTSLIGAYSDVKIITENRVPVADWGIYDSVYATTNPMWLYPIPPIVSPLGAEEGALTVTLVAPADNNQTQYPIHTFYFQSDNVTTSNCTLYYNGSAMANNPSTLNNTHTNLTPVGYGNHTYTWWVNCTFGSSESKSTVRTIIIDTDPAQYFQANDSKTGAAITDFTINAINSTRNVSRSTTNGTVVFLLSELPHSTSVTIIVLASGYNRTYFTESITANTWLNVTYSLDPAGIVIKAFDEVNSSQIFFNLTLLNSTSSTTINDLWEYNTTWNNTTTGSITAKISSNGYPEKRYYYSMSEYSLVIIDAYLLKATDGNYIRFHVLDPLESPLSNALVSARKQVGGSWVLTDQEYTDDAGISTLFLDPDVTYRIIAQYGGITDTRYITPTQSDYYIILGTAGNITFYTMFEGVAYSLTPTRNQLEYGTLTYVNYSVYCAAGDLENWGINITWNGTSIFYQINVTSSTGGTIRALVNVSSPISEGEVINATAWFKKLSYDEFDINRNYFARNSSYASISLFGIFGSLTPSRTGLSGGVRAIVAIIITGFLMVAIAGFTGYGGAGIIGAGILGIFAFMGWIDWLLYLMVVVVLVGSYALMQRGARY